MTEAASSLGFSVESQKTQGKIPYLFTKRRLVIGSATSSDIRLDDSQVSPIHAILEVNPEGTVTVYDLASDTGIKVNGHTTIQAVLKTGDLLHIGSFVLTLRKASDLEEKPSEDLAPLMLEDASHVESIFDYSTESKQSLQVVMFYAGTILDVEHFVNKKRIVIGPKSKDDFGVPAEITGRPSGHYELVSHTGEQYTLNLHESMSGVVSQAGQMKPVKQILADQNATKMIVLSDRDFAKVDLGDVSFFINFSPAPPRLKHQKILNRDPFFFRIWLTSLLFTIALIGTFTQVTVNPTIEIEQLPERIATVIYKPELLPIEQPKPKPEPKKEEPKKAEEKPNPPKPQIIKVTPKPVTTPPKKNPVIGKEEPKKQHKAVPQHAAAKPAPKVSPKPVAPKTAGNEGAGARAQGTEGSRGKPHAKPADTHQTKAQRPGEAKQGVARTQTGHSQVQNLGVVDVFKSTGGQISKLLAGGKGASGAADKLEGYGGFTTQGAGGLGAAGSGSGGGGHSLGLGGLADKGAGGGKKGTGLGALGSGGNIIGGKGTLVIAGTNGAPEPIVLGAIDSDAIAREVAKHRDEIKYCYEKEINAENPDLQGRINIRWVIGASGAVSSAGVSSTSMHNGNVERCVVDVIRRIVFPPVKGGGIAEVTYPFVFRPSTK